MKEDQVHSYSSSGSPALSQSLQTCCRLLQLIKELPCQFLCFFVYAISFLNVGFRHGATKSQEFSACYFYELDINTVNCSCPLKRKSQAAGT